MTRVGQDGAEQLCERLRLVGAGQGVGDARVMPARRAVGTEDLEPAAASRPVAALRDDPIALLSPPTAAKDRLRAAIGVGTAAGG